MSKHYLYITFLILFSACANVEEPPINAASFQLLDAKLTGIDFNNELTYDRNFNIYTYRNFYNGGGVAIGDVNNDGLADIYFTSNMSSNKLYINQGDFQFEETAKDAQVEGSKEWSTGVCMVDVNADGWLDIYVCNSGDVDGERKENELFINNQDGSFTEQAKEYGLADRGYSTHAAFFDYDKDGDLDMYLLNNSYRAISSFNPKINVRNKRDDVGGDKFFRNDDGKYTDVSEELGFYGSEIGFGLGVTVGDLDQNGWDDIYISNDFFEKDYLYMNNGDGSFTEDLENQMHSISVASMGADMADINNDGLAEIFVTEMLPSDERRIKTKTTFEDWDKYASNIKNGYYHQFTRNMLHLNNGDKSFSEIGRFAGVEASDWSWGALITDFDNDGNRDIFIANGINRDLTDQDFINYLSDQETVKKMTSGDKVNFEELIDIIPSERIPNCLFVNQGNLQFDDRAKELGLDQLSHSNGSAYGDLDNDGDLDLVVNNVNMPAFVYQNNAGQGNYIQFSFEGVGQNSQAIGVKVFLYAGEKIFYDQFMPTKGFQSSMDYNMHFGLGQLDALDSIKVIWPDQSEQILEEYVLNQRNQLKQPTNTPSSNNRALANKSSLFVDRTKELSLGFKHEENTYVDFDRDRLLFHMISTEGPKMEVGDLNGDGKDDFFICGAKDQASAIMIQNSRGFRSTNEALLSEFKNSEDLDVAFFDYDQDLDLDIYVCSGGNEFTNQSTDIIDRLLINDGKGNFTVSKERILPKGFIHSGSIAVSDIDQNGTTEILIGERIKSFQYGIPCDAFLLQKENGSYKDKSKTVAQGLKGKGMYTDIEWVDLDGDGNSEIVTCGKYMPISIFQNVQGKWEDKTDAFGLADTKGWWNTMEFSDVDGDGDLDIVAGNHGTNSRFGASADQPLCLHINDFDKNGSIEHIMCTYIDGKSYPMALRHDLVKQLPHLKKRILKYEDYALKGIEDIFSPEERKNTLTLEVQEMQTCLFLNDNMSFVKQELPMPVQFSPIYAIHTNDFNNDGHMDMIMGGNLYAAKPEIGRYDASRMIYLSGNGTGEFKALSARESGLLVEGEVRDIKSIKLQGKPHILISRNNDYPTLLQIKK